ncbi:MAG: ribose 5-phosphate isomerase B [Actinomycetota bacterium]
MRLAIGSDHAGFQLKTTISEHLHGLGHDVVDVGTHGEESVDYPDFGAAVGQAVATGDAELGIAVCGSGIGIGIAANKVPGVRAATVNDATGGHLCREHNNANVLCLGQRMVGVAVALDAVDAFLAAEFEGGRHEPRVNKITALEHNAETIA